MQRDGSFFLSAIITSRGTFGIDLYRKIASIITNQRTKGAFNGQFLRCHFPVLSKACLMRSFIFPVSKIDKQKSSVRFARVLWSMANLIGGLLVNVFCVNINFDKLALYHARKVFSLNSWALGLSRETPPGSTHRPSAAPSFVAELEVLTGRQLHRSRQGRHAPVSSCPCFLSVEQVSCPSQKRRGTFWPSTSL